MYDDVTLCMMMCQGFWYTSKDFVVCSKKTLKKGLCYGFRYTSKDSFVEKGTPRRGGRLPIPLQKRKLGIVGNYYLQRQNENSQKSVL